MKAITSKELKAEKDEEKRIGLENDMKKTLVNVWIDGAFKRMPLFELIETVGVKQKVMYWNYVEKPAPTKIRTSENPTVIKAVTHDYGLIFNDGSAIKHVSAKVFNYCKGELIKKRERL